MNLKGLTTKDITKDFIRKHFDLDAERKNKKITYEEIYTSENIYDEFEKSLSDFTTFMIDLQNKTLKNGFNASNIKVNIRVHNGYNGCSCCSEPSYAELVVYAKNCYRKETDEEVIARLRRKIKKELKKND